ncbi:MAG: protein-L-isoaspartate(D-aspartate) O-methyltransferase [Spirochaetes bacterium]|nr:protein-L-isoaspartate(D-aspartate) O-methyltransferase [Spirochaetota bacterium]
MTIYLSNFRMQHRIVLLLPLWVLSCHLLFCLGKEEPRKILDKEGRSFSPQQEAAFNQKRERMVVSQIEARGVRDPKVLAALRKVPRHRFVPPPLEERAYDDTPLPIGYGQTISQPYIVAYMTEALQLKGTEKVLEIGTGSGYQAAILAEITPHVCSIEIIPELTDRARKILDETGYGFVKTRKGDGYYGWDEESPFDAIIVTAAAGHVPPPLLHQLKTGGKLLIPLGGPYEVQMLTLVEKMQDGTFRTTQLLPVRFVPFTRKTGTMK